jgi:hypothetical protein
LSENTSVILRTNQNTEGISDEMTAKVRLGLISATVVLELARLPRGNQVVVARSQKFALKKSHYRINQFHCHCANAQSKTLNSMIDAIAVA